LSITASLGRGASCGASWKPGEPCGISGLVSSARALRSHTLAWRSWKTPASSVGIE
jgi:hypothetical protein